MLALGRALVARPKLLLLDEPSLGLAPTVVRQFYALVGSLISEMGLTFVVVEQNAAVALKATKRTYVLEVGTIAMEGPSDELLQDERVRKAYLGD
jgi:branched-chain amino acid transport system ATP-binding protein